MLNCALNLCSNKTDPLANFVKLGQIEKDKVASSRNAQVDINRDLVNYPNLLLLNLGGGGGLVTRYHRGGGDKLARSHEQFLRQLQHKMGWGGSILWYRYVWEMCEKLQMGSKKIQMMRQSTDKLIRKMEIRIPIYRFNNKKYLTDCVIFYPFKQFCKFVVLSWVTKKGTAIFFQKFRKN